MVQTKIHCYGKCNFECKRRSKIKWIFTTERIVVSRLLLLSRELLRWLLLLGCRPVAGASSRDLRRHVHSTGGRPRLRRILSIHEATHSVATSRRCVVVVLYGKLVACAAKVQALREICTELGKRVTGSRIILLGGYWLLLLLLLVRRWELLRWLLLLLLWRLIRLEVELIHVICSDGCLSRWLLRWSTEQVEQIVTLGSRILRRRRTLLRRCLMLLLLHWRRLLLALRWRHSVPLAIRE